MNCYLGLDFGTSGARACLIDDTRQIQGQFQRAYDPDLGLAETWRSALFGLLQDLPGELRSQTRAIALNGTSSTVLLCDARGTPLDEPILYNDSRGAEVLEQVRAIAPPHHPVLSATSSLAKLLWWQQSLPVASAYFLHQADWLGFLLHGHLGISDYHNSLKLGYDVGQLTYPDWLSALAVAPLMPQVLPPGTPISPLRPELVQTWGFPADCWVCAGTTDSIAAFLASGATTPGEAVTSLGSTLVLKLLSHTRVDDARHGIYSHRLGDQWLVGGASNTGGAVLQQFFSPTELTTLSRQIQPDQPSPLDYYPLIEPGERFPINDPQLPPRLDPRPADPVAFLQGLLESMARIEAQGYAMLQDLGAPPLTRVHSAGGGAGNATWTQIRARYLHVPVLPAPQTEAAYGSALLAQRGLDQNDGSYRRDQPEE